MKNRVQKWGNSLAVRIPKALAEGLGWKENAPVEMSLDGEALVIRTDKERAWDFDALVSGITDENIHPAWEAESAAAFPADAGGENTKDGGDGR